MARATKITFNWAGIRQQAERQVKVGLNLKVLSRRTRQAAEAQQLPPMALSASRHYGGALVAIREFLRVPGQTGITRDGYRTAHLTSSGLPVNVRTPQPWARLSSGYIKHTPRSVTFWRKTGALSRLYQAVVLSILNQKPSLAVTSATTRARKLEISARVGLGTLPDPLGHIVGLSFTTGRVSPRPRVRGIGTGARQTILRMSFPEANRPVISAIAARLGREMHAALRKLD
jgi:hypothetical protein